MFEISVISDFSSAHNLKGYQGKCEDLHGHNWKIEAVLSCPDLDKIGMVVDFKIVKEKLNSILVGLDHKYLNQLPPFKETNPTSENIAKFIFEGLKELMDGAKAKVLCVKVWETSTSCAAYHEE